MHHETGPFTLPDIRDFVPEKLKPWIMIAMLMVVQVCGGVYLAAVAEISGSTALLHEDIMMAGYATLVGMALTFTIMFRLKFRFTTKVGLMICAAVLIACNLVTMHTTSVPLLVATCFVAGIFRMWATFFCNTVIQLWITPVRDMSVWFCYIQLIVQGAIQLSGLATTYVAWLSKWEYMHWVVIGLLLVMMLVLTTCFRTFQGMRKLPLYGIDWLGAALWGVTVMSALFVLVYGDHYDWFGSPCIRIAAAATVVSLALNIWRATFVRHPYIDLQTWRYPVVYMTFIIYIVLDLLLSPSHLFEHIYFESILGYDSLNTISLNWAVLAGVVFAAFFSWRTFARLKWSYKGTTALGFALCTAYLLIFYFTIDYNLPKEAFILPLFLRSAGYTIVAIVFLTVLMRIPIFPQFAQSLSVQAFVSASLGGTLGTAVLTHIFKHVMKSNALTLSATLDRVNPEAVHMPLGQLYGAVQRQAMIVSMKEICGALAIAGIFCLLLFMLRESDIVRPYRVIHPTFAAIRSMIKARLDRIALVRRHRA